MSAQKTTRGIYLNTFATSLFIQICTVFQGVLLARLLGPNGRGEFASVILWPSVFAGIGILGINMAIARFAGQGISSGRLVKTAIKAAVFTGVLSAIVCGILLPVLLPEDKHHLLPAAYLFLLFIPVNHLGMNLQGIDHGAGNFNWLNITRALIYPVFFLGVLICWVLADKVFWVVVCLLIANGSVVLLRLFAKRKDLRNELPDVGYIKLIKESFPYITASLISILYMQMDKALLVWLLAPEDIGWYVAAFAASGSINVLNGALGIVQFSAAAQSKPRYGFVDLASVLRRGGIVSIMGGSVLAIMLPFLIPLVYGAAFQPATAMAFILLPGLILAGLGEIVNQALRGQGQPLAGVLSKLVGLIVMGIAGIYLSGFMGGRGIALGYVLGESTAFVGLFVVAISYYRDASWKDLLPSIVDIKFLWFAVLKRKRKI